MRTTAVAALVAVVGLVLGGCARTTAGTPAPDPAAMSAQDGSTPGSLAPAAPAGEKFVDPAKRFTLVPPKDWKPDTTSGAPKFAVIFTAPAAVPSAKAPFRPNVNVLLVPAPGAPLEAVVDGLRKDVATLDGYHSTLDAPLTLADGTVARQLGCTFTDPAAGNTLRNLQLIAVHDDTAIVVTGTAPADGWGAYAATLDSTLRSLTVTT